MLTDKQSLLLCTLIVVAFFVGGILDILDNYVAMGIFTILILIVILNIIITKYLNNKD